MAALPTTTPARAAPAAASLPAPAVELRATLLAWYDRHRRAPPWRAGPGLSADPWAVLVSEVMLQQTTVATVTPRYRPFLDRFPMPAAMAAVPLDDVLHAWQGLGYYRRARALHAAAIAIVERHGGRVPDDLAALRALPGLGAYTAAAVAAIAFGRPVLPLDTNVHRVLGRLGAIDRGERRAELALAAMATALADPQRPGDLAQALMDLGAGVCTPRAPACLACPWHDPCRARAEGGAAVPRAPPNAKLRPQRFGVAFVLRRAGDDAVLFRRRPEAGLLPGMIEVPSTTWDAAPPSEPAWSDAPPGIVWTEAPAPVRHVFTHLTLQLRVWSAIVDTAGPEGSWVLPADFAALALPTLTRKVLAAAGLPLPPLAERGRVTAARRPADALATATAGR